MSGHSPKADDLFLFTNRKTDFASTSLQKRTGNTPPSCCRRNIDMSTWIDFKTLREQLDFAAVLKHYGVEVKLKGDQHQGFCPLPSHNGKRNSPSFSANMKRKI